MTVRSRRLRPLTRAALALSAVTAWPVLAVAATLAGPAAPLSYQASNSWSGETLNSHANTPTWSKSGASNSWSSTPR